MVLVATLCFEDVVSFKSLAPAGEILYENSIDNITVFLKKQCFQILMTRGVYIVNIYIVSKPGCNNVKFLLSDNIATTLAKLNKDIEDERKRYYSYAVYCLDVNYTEKKLTKYIEYINPDLKSMLVSDTGELVEYDYYDLGVEEAYKFLMGIAGLSGTLDNLHYTNSNGKIKELNYLNKKNDKEISHRKSRFRFSLCGIEPGEKVQFLRNPNVVVTVYDDTHVVYKERITTLSVLGAELLHYRRLTQGSMLFTYKGVLLETLRRSLEK